MFITDTLIHRLRRGCETMAYPQGPAPALPARHGGALKVDSSNCAAGCAACVEVCPTGAITRAGGRPVALDFGRCVLCAECIDRCLPGAITRTGDHRMAVRERGDLLLGEPGREQVRLAGALEAQLLKLFGRSLRMRQVSAGGCNGCEADINVLGTIGWDLGRFGIQLVASPRHADGLLVTGPVSKGMELALKKTYEAVPAPKLVIAVGACAISGGPFIGHPQVNHGVDGILPVDLYIPGCPPHPLTILDGLLRMLDKLAENSVAQGGPRVSSD